LDSNDFPYNRNAGSLNEISWDDWFKKFDAERLALLYQEHTAGGEMSNFNKLVSRQAVDEVEAAVGGKGRSASRWRSRRGVEVDVIAASREGRPRRDDTQSVGSRKVSKKSAAAAEIVTTTKKQSPTRDVPQSRSHKNRHRASARNSLSDALPSKVTIKHGGEMQMSHTHSDVVHLRSDEDPPIPIPPGEEPPPPIEEPPDKPVIGPDAPVREPGPREPKRL
jgi:hypothetical protein